MYLLKDDIDVSLRRGGRGVPARPLHQDGSELLEGLHQAALSQVPGHTAQEDFAGKDRVLVWPRWQLARPGAVGVVEGGRVAVHLGGPVQGGGVRGVGHEQGVHLLTVSQQAGGSYLENQKQLVTLNPSREH